MVQPYDYRLSTPSPGEVFFKSIQLGQQQQQAEAQREQARLKNEEALRAKQLQSDVSSWVSNPTPDGFRELSKKYPMEFTKLAGVQKAVEDIDRPAIRNVATNALMAHRNNQPEQVLSILDQRIEAAKDDPQLQKKFQDMKKGYQLYPDNKKLQEAAIVTVLAQDDEGIKIYDRAFKQTEPYVVAGDNLYLKSDIERAVAESEGTGSSNINVKPVVPMGAVEKLKADPKLAVDFDKKYGTPKNPNPSILILGGQTGSAPSGNFQGQ